MRMMTRQTDNIANDAIKTVPHQCSLDLGVASEELEQQKAVLI
jgi:hypothetical protein